MKKLENLEICMWAINFPDQLIQGCETFNEKSLDIKTYDCTLYINVDPYPDNKNIEQMEEIAKKYFKFVDISYGKECFPTKAPFKTISKVKNEVCFVVF